MKDINETMDEFPSGGQSPMADRDAFARSQSKTTSSKDDYIDFEEIK